MKTNLFARTNLRLLLTIAGASAAIGLAGCSDEDADRLLATPAVVPVGTFDGCDVKFVNRGYASHSFYLAKCEQTTTATQNYREQVGRTSQERRKVTITQEIKRLQAEQQELEVRDAALGKLTAKERAALGVAPEAPTTKN